VARFLLYAAGIAILLMIAMFAWSIYRSLEAEKTLHATDIVIDAYAEFCKENAGRFPASWGDLGSARVSSRASFAWPDDMARIRERVEVDFGGATCELA
jgi:hypothetical protein